MTNVVPLPERLGVQLARIRASTDPLARDLFYNAVGDAYRRVLSHHPDVTDPEEQFSLALRIASASLYAAASELARNPPVLLTELRVA